MRCIDEAVEDILQRRPLGALPLAQLVEALRASARVADHEGDVQRALSAHPDRFRIVDPYRGPWRIRPEGGEQRRPGVWVVGLEDPPSAPLSTRLERVVVACVRTLAVALDQGSFTAGARWLAIRSEAEEILGRVQSTEENQPERHSSSASTSTSENPDWSVAA